jgi:mono/diheme cytochrome c family protein
VYQSERVIRHFFRIPSGIFNLTESTKKVYNFFGKSMKKIPPTIGALILGVFGALLPEFPSIAAAVPVDFAREIQPIFAEHCTKCHGLTKPKAGLNLAVRASVVGKLKSGERAIVPGQPAKSELLRRITTHDADDLMPPADKGQRLSQPQIARIRQWIAEGAEWSIHWAYRPLAQPTPPKVKDAAWARNHLDHFVLARLEANQIQPSPPADRHTLIKRLSYDLLGLPPTPKEVDDFVNDKSPAAYGKLVDRLLASPHYGERWGRHWLDKARYADSDGYEKDRPRPNAWRYRDWVIRSINRDLSFDQFTIEQLAGDLLPKATDSQKLATAFNRQTLTNTEGGTDQEQWRVAAVMDRVETLGTVWLGLTVGCARCHNHKYDQLTQQEYYQLFAYFNNGDESNASVARSKKEHEAWLEAKAAHDASVKALQKKLAARDEVLKAQLPRLEKQLKAKMAVRAANPETFQPLEASSVKGPKGVNFTPQKDASFLVTGTNPAKAAYTLEFTTAVKEITGLKIESLPDASLKAQGPGRTPHGNFVLNNIQVYATDTAKIDAQKHRVALSGAHADFAQKEWPAAHAIDGKTGEGKKGTGWAVGPRYGKPHWLIVTTAKPIMFKGTTKIRLVLEQQYGSQHTLGKFRITARTGQSASDGIPTEVAKILKVEPGQRSAKQTATLLAHLSANDAEAKKLRAELAQPAPKPPVMNVRVISQRTKNPRATHVLHRGEFKQPKSRVNAGTLGTLPKIQNRQQGDRLDLARWLVDGKNPLAPRVAVNHIWANLFGEGLVGTMNDFGVRGDAPTHPALLDWLATEFIRRKWSRKDMIRLIVGSATYRQSSAHRPELADIDPNNRLWHRQNRFRVEAEIIRDLALSASGLLSRKVGGPSVFPPLPAGVAALSYANNFKWKTSQGVDRYRRGLYTFFKRTSPHPNLLLFDCPDSNVTCVKRNISNTPLAALTTLNNEVYTEAAKALAQRMMKVAPTDTGRITHGFRLCVARAPSVAEHAALTRLFKKAKSYYQANAAEAKVFGGNPEASAWTATARVLLNLDEFITRE